MLYFILLPLLPPHAGLSLPLPCRFKKAARGSAKPFTTPLFSCRLHYIVIAPRAVEEVKWLLAAS